VSEANEHGEDCEHWTLTPASTAARWFSHGRGFHRSRDRHSVRCAVPTLVMPGLVPSIHAVPQLRIS